MLASPPQSFSDCAKAVRRRIPEIDILGRIGWDRIILMHVISGER
jgi:hypothetical protein